jgi:ATP-dependent RNA helicase RhlE
MLFSELNLAPTLLKAVEAEGYTTPTPIQQQAIPPALEGRDVIGLAQTGTGKTAAFSLPILQRLGAHSAAGMRCLVLTPTRELAAQIGDSLHAYGKHTGLRHAVIFGGVGQDAQVKALRSGLDILVATPGRLLDLMQQGFVQLAKIEVFVLDEADRMLDMGFIHDVRKVIAKLPPKRQTLFFSATMPPDIQQLADAIVKDPVQVAVTPVSSTAERITQSVYFVEKARKRDLLVHLLKDAAIARALVFTRTKHGANRVAEALVETGTQAAAIHGNKSQGARERALKGFKDGSVRILVATDIAARGIDVDGVTHVINFDLPNVPESYVHRIGRTARAGASGLAMSFCDHEEREFLRDIERLTRQHVPVVVEHPYASHLAPPPKTDLEARQTHRPPQNGGGRPQGHGGGGGGGRRPQGGGGGRPQGGGGGRPQGQGGGRPQGQGAGARPQGHGGGRPQGGGHGAGRPQGQPQGQSGRPAGGARGR